jgi:hypothetical protein
MMLALAVQLQALEHKIDALLKSHPAAVGCAVVKHGTYASSGGTHPRPSTKKLKNPVINLYSL